jgi:Holliday junction resolvase RusA-like endonuclease
MRPSTSFFVTGHPKSQPRARARQFGKGVYNPDTADGWKACIRADWKALQQPAWEGPLKVSLTFYFARPAAHYGTGKNALNLKPTAPLWHTKKPDRDNLDKAVMDALTNAGAWADDCQVCAGSIRKVWGPLPGVRISISEAPDNFNPSDN